MENIIVTGSSGLVATELINKLAIAGNYQVFAVSTNPVGIEKRYAAYENIQCLSLDELRILAGRKRFTALVHCAFARNRGGREIASSLEYLRELITIMRYSDLGVFINLSSQSVYGQKEKPLWTEETPVDPNHPYAVGKYASEVLVKLAFTGTDIRFTNLRLASVSGNARFLNIFIENALHGLPIKVIGGNQLVSFIDSRDVANALVAVIEKERVLTFADVYNLGTKETITILELAEAVQRIYRERHSMNVTIVREDADISLEIGMDNNFFVRTFGWQPKHGYKDMIISLIEDHSMDEF